LDVSFPKTLSHHVETAKGVMMASFSDNLFADVPAAVPDELVDVLARSTNVRIERIVSTGQSSPEDFWYDQDENEWVTVLKGEGQILFDDGQSVQLLIGDHVLIPAHRKHRVEWTTPEEPTIWLAVFYRD
jgi:cupin 2 domain-containing protein